MPSSFYKSRACRQRALLLPPRIDDYIGADNPARAIEAYVDTRDLIRLGFRHAERVIGAGQPPYDPADLLKLYLYGYLNQIRSSRRLEREAGRNIELMWLLGDLVPGYRTIAKFRAENAAPLRQVNRDFVLILHQLGLVGGAMVAIDGAFFDGNDTGQLHAMAQAARAAMDVDGCLSLPGRPIVDGDARRQDGRERSVAHQIRQPPLGLQGLWAAVEMPVREGPAARHRALGARGGH